MTEEPGVNRVARMMASVEIKQCINHKYLVKLTKLSNECLKFLQEVYDDDVVSHA